MSINLDELLAQRAEATGVDGDRVSFDFAGKTFSFRDPLMLTDEEKDELAELELDVDVAEWYMGEDEYDRFVTTETEITTPGGSKRKVSGNSSIFFVAFREYQQKATEDLAGKSPRPNRSSRRSEARKQRKQR